MNKLTKIGVSALCGSLASIVSANAGSLDVTGGATATWSSNEGTVTGNPIGMDSGISFAGTGELDNGTTFTLAIDHADQSAYSAASISMTTPSIGTFTIDQGAGGAGVDRLDDMMPTAWEETTGTSLGTGIQTVAGVGGSTNIEWAVPESMLPDGLTAHFAISPKADGTASNDKAGSGDTGSANQSGWDIVLQHSGLVDGLNVFAGYSDIETGELIAKQSQNHTNHVIGATYATGGLTMGYQWSKDNVGLSAAASTSYYENNAYGVSFSVNDDLSVSFGVHESERVLGNNTSVTAEAQSFQVAYSMGGASIKLAETQGKDLNYTSGSSMDRDATTVALSLAF